MKVSIIVPAHNEDKIIWNTLSSLYRTLDQTTLDFEVIAVDDNSSDHTLETMQGFAVNRGRVKVVHKEGGGGPSGLGSALTFGFEYANGEIVIPFMGDLSDDPKDVQRLVAKVEEGYDIVCGSRFIEGGKAKGYPMLKLISHRAYNKIFSLFFGLDLADFSNAFKAYRKSIFGIIKPESVGFEFSAEVTLKARILGLKIAEIPVVWENRKEGASKLGSFSPTPRFILSRLPKIGWRYVKVATRLYFKYLSSKIRKPVWDHSKSL